MTSEQPLEGGGFYVRDGFSLEDATALVETAEYVFYSPATCWWTLSESDLYGTPELAPRAVRRPLHPSEKRPGAVPGGPRNEPLLMTDSVAAWWAAAMANPEAYGRHGFEALMAAYHGNVVVARRDFRPTSFRTWPDYNRVIDEAVAAAIGGPIDFTGDRRN